VRRSSDRILTTHAGSLIRTPAIIEGMKARLMGAPYDHQQLAADIEMGIADVVRKQVEVGIAIPNDGEFGRRGFTSYVHERLGGLQSRPPEPGERMLGPGAERLLFPEFSEQYDRHFRLLWMYPEISMEEVKDTPANGEWFRLTAPISYVGQQSVQGDIARLRKAIECLEVADAFITAVTPNTHRYDSGIERFYSSKAAYLYAVADALHEEYRAIADSGFVLQLDFAALNPQGLIDRTRATRDEVRRARDLAIDVVDHALRGIPEERVRYHHCWGGNNRPHTTDSPLREIVEQLLRIKVGAYAVEAANPRHEHEWMVWKDVKLPEGKILIPGVISQSTNVVEHPELVAWRIENFASVVGKENVIAGVDCGFSQYWDQIRVHPSVQWAKLQALADGAALATRKLWGKQRGSM
jgi:5-methyltetrahydropteroyltriglutamate--homocysteine methyltransferase